MSDRHSAEKTFNSLLEDYREKILSEVKIGWNDLSDEEKSGIVHLNSFCAWNASDGGNGRMC